ncbi:MAG: thioredoxin family protein [Candidatus Helarchaeota archaeon]
MSPYRLPNLQQIKREFQKLRNPIEISLFLSPEEDPESFPAYEFINTIANQDPKIKLNLITKQAKPELFNQYHIKEVPAIVIEDSGIVYTGVPSGPEAMMFIQTLIMKSTENTGIGEVISRVLASLTKPVLLRTIITSQCTICPLAVKIGNMLALESALTGGGLIKHEIIEALEHPDYVAEYDLSAVPIILINNEIAFNGIPDVDEYVLKIAKAGKSVNL